MGAPRKDAPRDQRVVAYLTTGELAQVDRARSNLSRAAFIRSVVVAAARRALRRAEEREHRERTVAGALKQIAKGEVYA